MSTIDVQSTPEQTTGTIFGEFYVEKIIWTRDELTSYIKVLPRRRKRHFRTISAQLHVAMRRCTWERLVTSRIHPVKSWIHVWMPVHASTIEQCHWVINANVYLDTMVVNANTINGSANRTLVQMEVRVMNEFVCFLDAVWDVLTLHRYLHQWYVEPHSLSMCFWMDRRPLSASDKLLHQCDLSEQCRLPIFGQRLPMWMFEQKLLRSSLWSDCYEFHCSKGCFKIDRLCCIDQRTDGDGFHCGSRCVEICVSYWSRWSRRST